MEENKDFTHQKNQLQKMMQKILLPNDPLVNDFYIRRLGNFIADYDENDDEILRIGMEIDVKLNLELVSTYIDELIELRPKMENITKSISDITKYIFTDKVLVNVNFFDIGDLYIGWQASKD